MKPVPAVVIGFFFLALLATPASAIPIEEQFKTPAELQKRLAEIKTGADSAFLVFADAQNGVQVVEATDNRAVINVPKYFQLYYFPNAGAKAFPDPDALFKIYNKAARQFGVVEGNTRPPVQMVLESPKNVPIQKVLDCNSAFKTTCLIRPVPGLKIKVVQGGRGTGGPKEGTRAHANLQMRLLPLKKGSAILLFTDWSNGIRATVSSRTAFFDAPRGMDAYVFLSFSEQEQKDPSLLMLRTKDASRLRVLKGTEEDSPFAPVKMAVTHATKDLTRYVTCKKGAADYCLIRYEPGMRLEFRGR